MVKPISLRVYQTAVTVRARKLLRELDEKDKQQRRIKWQATKALIVLSELRAAAAPQVQRMLTSDRSRWLEEFGRVKSFLEKVKDRGV